MRNSKFKNRMISHKSENKKEMLEKFFKSENLVFLSPSSTEGLDLKDDLSRFQIFCKVPFLSLGDKQISRRAKIDTQWYSYMTVLSIVQGTGRSMGNEEDYCVTYMLDGAFRRLYNQNKKMFPNDFKKTLLGLT